MYVHACVCPSMSPGAGVRGGCELSDVGAGNRTQVLQEQESVLAVELSTTPAPEYIPLGEDLVILYSLFY